MVEEFDIPAIREIVFEDYRIIYHYDGIRVLILTVKHGSHPLTKSDLSGD